MVDVALLVGGSLPAIWLTLSIVLVLVEVLHPAGFFVSFALAALVVSAKTAIWPPMASASPFLDEAIFAVLGVALIVPLRRVIVRFLDKTPNINEL